MAKRKVNSIKKVTIATMCVAILAVQSCTKEVIEISDNVNKRHINATANQSGVDKANMNPSTLQVLWQSADTLNVNGAYLPLTEIQNGGTFGRFSGTATPLQSGSNDVFWAVYPQNLVPKSQTLQPGIAYNTLDFNFPQNQSYDISEVTSSSALEGYTYMAGRQEVQQGESTINFSMKNLATVLKLRLEAGATESNRTISLIEITSSTPLAGGFRVSSDIETITPLASASYKHSVRLSTAGANGIDISTAKDIYVILPPIEGESLSMRVYNTSGKYAEKNVANCTLERNKIYTTTVENLAFRLRDTGFSVSSVQKVFFAPGNLQYRASTGTWRFAENQWDFVGGINRSSRSGVPNAQYGTVRDSPYSYRFRNDYISSTYDGWIDLFGWGTSGYNNEYPYMYQENDAQYGQEADIAGTSYDWGLYCNIFDPSSGRPYSAGSWWRTLTYNEWYYLLVERSTVSGIRYVKAKIENVINHNGNDISVKGILLFPDNWDASQYPGVLAVPNRNPDRDSSSFDDNTLTLAQWSVLERQGVAFLPQTGNRQYGINQSGRVELFDVFDRGFYWSSSYGNNRQAYDFHFGSDVVFPGLGRRYIGRSVRLAVNVEIAMPTAP